jgi:hypothetical protein
MKTNDRAQTTSAAPLRSAAPRRRARPHWLLPLALIVAAAALLTLPAAFSGTRTNDSFWIDWVWVDQFAHQLGHGILYPRWLTQSHAGLGSPVFYYYPPLAFYVAAPFVWSGVSVYGAILGMFFIGYLLSGAAMYLWLKDQAPAPLLGSMIFLAAPYHSFNFYMRGAMAEFLAMAMIPLVMLGLRRMSERRAGGLPLASLGYAAMICTHLPLTLLASIFLFGPYCLLLGRRDALALGRLGGALATGGALAAIYLVPALALAPYRDVASLWILPTLRPSNWTLWHPAKADLNAMRDVLIIAASLAIPLASLALRNRSGWAMFGLLCIALAIGLVPAIWTLPIVKSVQFPFRLLPIAEFALATAIATLPRRELSLPLALLPAAMTFFVLAAPPLPPAISMQELRQNHPDVPENLPPAQRPYTWPSRWALALAATHRQPVVVNGITTEPVFYFPAWQVRCEGKLVATFPAPQTQLLSHRGTGCTRTLGTTTPEWWGALISLATLIVLIAVCLVGWRLRRTALRPKGEPQEVTS